MISSFIPRVKTQTQLFGFVALLTYAVLTPDVSGANRLLSRTQRLYIGTYSSELSKGIYLAEFDSKTGKMSEPRLVAEMDSPSWITIHPNGKYLYAAGESKAYPDGGLIAAFSIQRDGGLTAINSHAPNGDGPCHLGIDATGRTMLVSNYGSGNVSSLQINNDGSLEPSNWKDQYPSLEGKQKPHAHHACFDPTNQYAVVCDAGLDRICVYRFDEPTGKLTAQDPPFATTAPETHPRHLTFSLDGRFCFDINEKAMSVTSFEFDAKQGKLSEIQTISTLPENYEGKVGSTAELILHPSGDYLYGSNRGPDNIVCYRVDTNTGKLTLVGHASTQGKTARSFGIDQTGRWMVVGNQNSDSVVTFSINRKTGIMQPTGSELTLGSPVCFQFQQIRRQLIPRK